jgi:squalene cyclase
MKRQAAITFVRSTGDLGEQARLRHLLDREHPAPAIMQQVLAGQREDGGWCPFWASDYSSLDATCFRLAQAEQLGMTANEAAVRHALTFLARRQHEDGSWEEEERMAEDTPPWATPGVLAAHLYLTANCGFWLAALGDPSENAQRAASYLQRHLDEEGQLPSFLHAHWLAGGLWYRIHWQEAIRVFSYLQRRLSDLAVSNLAWLLSTLLLAGVPSDHPLIEQAASRLEQQQEQDGRWPSEDGSARDVHTTLEAMRVLRLCSCF